MLALLSGGIEIHQTVNTGNGRTSISQMQYQNRLPASVLVHKQVSVRLAAIQLQF